MSLAFVTRGQRSISEVTIDSKVPSGQSEYSVVEQQIVDARSLFMMNFRAGVRRHRDVDDWLRRNNGLWFEERFEAIHAKLPSHSGLLYPSERR